MIGKVQHLGKIAKAINYATESQRVNSQNLANINTPGYHTKKIPFDQLLDQLSEKKPAGPLGNTFTPESVEGLRERLDGNNVDLDNELADLKKNALAFQTLTQLLGSELSILKRAING